MKIKFLGTGAAEGIPSMFCECTVCKTARITGGKNIRTRSQAIVNDDLLIDFCADMLIHTIMQKVDMTRVKNCIVTHAHPDHLYPNNIIMRMPPFSYIKNIEPFNIYGSEAVVLAVESITKAEGMKEDAAKLHVVKPFEPFVILNYTITALPARHSVSTGPFIYLIQQVGKNLLYAHDTGYLLDEVFEYLKNNKIRLDFVSLDCTLAFSEEDYYGHMNVLQGLKVKDMLYVNGSADAKTLFCFNHFSHNGEDVLYDEFAKQVQAYGFSTSYDEMEVVF